MTQSEFIKAYCEKSNITEERLNELGQFAILCDCNDSSDCKGWAMVGRQSVKSHIDLYLNLKD